MLVDVVQKFPTCCSSSSDIPRLLPCLILVLALEGAAGETVPNLGLLQREDPPSR
jgi:hypothetical protein